jgi:hypothetical protein
MAKKTKRQQRIETSNPPAENNQPNTPAPGLVGRAGFNPDYTYVAKDLRRIGILAGTFIVILVALAFILPLVIH